MVRPRVRWITIGILGIHHPVLFRGWGCPDGFLMAWNGRVSPVQPMTFIRWDDVVSCVMRRLEIAGLEMVSMASDVKRHWNNIPLRVLVRRRAEGKL